MFELKSFVLLVPFLMSVAALIPLAILVREPRSTAGGRRRR